MLFLNDANFRRYFGALGCTNLADGMVLLSLPWLASMITSDAFLIALITIGLRLPWMLFSLPFGVLADRHPHKTLMLWANVLRGCIATLGVAFVVAGPQLPLGPEDANLVLWLIGGLALIAFAYGVGEVLHDNTGQTALPKVVKAADLEKANGQLWSLEFLLGNFLGPPIAGAIILWHPSLPMVAIALLILVAPLLLRGVRFDVVQNQSAASESFGGAIKTGLAWMRAHPLFLRLALILAGLNFLGTMQIVILVLFAQEIVGLNAQQYGLVLGAGAVGGILGGLIGPKITGPLGARFSVFFGLVLIATGPIIMSFTQSAWLVGLAEALVIFGGTIWNIVTVSLRQKHVPAALLGRVNSVYRFLGWGVIAIGGVCAGALVSFAEPSLGREAALRVPYIISAIITPLLLLFAVFGLKFPSAKGDSRSGGSVVA